MKAIAVIWDIDGTLIDSEPLHHESLALACDHYDVDISDLGADHFAGVNMHGVWEALCARFPADLNKEAWLDAVNAIYCRRVPQLAEIRGATAVVKSLQRNRIRQAAVSNSARIVVDANLDRLGISQALELSLSLDDVVRPKPDPYPYARALELLRLEASEAIAVEDSLSGATSAKAAGIHTIGYRNESIGADRTVQSLAEVAQFILGEPFNGL